MSIHVPAPQGTEAWKMERLGKVTASRVADVIARTKKGWSTSRENYMNELIAERLTGVPVPHHVTPEMRWGTEKEPEACIAYEFHADVEVDKTGFVDHPELDAGASPDRLVGDDGLVEFKCPTTTTHVNTILADEIPEDHQTQMMWQMGCTGRQWCDFASFDPRVPERVKLYVKRLMRDDAKIAELTQLVADFIGELEAKLARIMAVTGQSEIVLAAPSIVPEPTPDVAVSAKDRVANAERQIATSERNIPSEPIQLTLPSVPERPTFVCRNFELFN